MSTDTSEIIGKDTLLQSRIKYALGFDSQCRSTSCLFAGGSL